jgi:hypothetical protein
MKEELRGFWLINRKLLGILVYYNIVDLLLLCIETLGRRTYSHTLIDQCYTSFCRGVGTI